MNHYLQYIKPETARRESGHPFAHTASNQPLVGKVTAGDVLWIVTILDGRLILRSRFPVGAVVSTAEAERRLRKTNIWPGKYHVLTPNLERIEDRAIDISEIADELRFEGGVERLPRGFGGQHLQAFRKLTDSTAQQLESTWKKRRAVGTRTPNDEHESGPASPRRVAQTLTGLKAPTTYTTEAQEREVQAQHYNYQLRLSDHLQRRGITPAVEQDFVDVRFEREGVTYIGEIKVTTSLTREQAFHAALGQVLFYGHTKFDTPPARLVFLDCDIPARWTLLASQLGVGVITEVRQRFKLLNPEVMPPLVGLFG